MNSARPVVCEASAPPARRQRSRSSASDAGSPTTTRQRSGCRRWIRRWWSAPGSRGSWSRIRSRGSTLRRSPRFLGSQATRKGASSASPPAARQASSAVSERRLRGRRDGGSSTTSKACAGSPSGRRRSIHSRSSRSSSALDASSRKTGRQPPIRGQPGSPGGGTGAWLAWAMRGFYHRPVAGRRPRGIVGLAARSLARARREPTERAVSPEVRRPREAWIPLIAGLFWLWRAPDHGLFGFLFGVLPGCLMLGSGVAMLMMPGDRRIAQFGALGGVLGIVFALPAFLVQGFGAGLLLMAASLAGFLAAGVHGLLLEPAVEGVPMAVFSLRLAAEVAVDEALLATMFVAPKLPRADDHVRIPRELAEARARFEAEGWLEKPESYHLPPPPLEAPRIDPARIRGHVYEHLRFESGYQPHAGEPGRERWLSYAANRTAHAWVLRHPGPTRPWLICLHGYQMGWPLIDLLAFQPEVLHRRLGVNLLVPTLPLHGLRKQGRRSGDGFLSGDPLDTVHAEAQAMWDLRRLLSWLREDQQAPAVGALGFSLGGYNTALLASLDEGLACAVAGIPVTDFARIS